MMGLTPLIFLALGLPPLIETQTFELKFCEPPIPELFRRARFFLSASKWNWDWINLVRSVRCKEASTNPIRGHR